MNQLQTKTYVTARGPGKWGSREYREIDEGVRIYDYQGPGKPLFETRVYPIDYLAYAFLFPLIAFKERIHDSVEGGVLEGLLAHARSSIEAALDAVVEGVGPIEIEVATHSDPINELRKGQWRARLVPQETRQAKGE